MGHWSSVRKAPHCCRLPGLSSLPQNLFYLPQAAHESFHNLQFHKKTRSKSDAFFPHMDFPVYSGGSHAPGLTASQVVFIIPTAVGP